MWRWGGVVLGVFLCALAGLSACSRTQYGHYVVRSGETLSEIGYAYRIPYPQLAALNGIRNPDRIAAGQRLRIPPGARYDRARAATARSARSRQEKRQARLRGRSKSPPPPKETKKLFSWPLNGRLTSRFGPRNGSFHDGIDIAAPTGTPVRAAAAGRVVFSDALRGYGNVVIVKHANDFTTVYAHHHRNLVRDGQRVRRGEIVGEVGETGRVTGPSLHFEVRRGKNARNPLHYLPPVRHATQRK